MHALLALVAFALLGLAVLLLAFGRSEDIEPLDLGPLHKHEALREALSRKENGDV